MKPIIILFLIITVVTWLLVTWIFVTFWLIFNTDWNWAEYFGFWLLVEGAWFLLITVGAFYNKEDK